LLQITSSARFFKGFPESFLGWYLLPSLICFNKFFMQDGMQWEIFLKFLAKLEEHCEIVLIGSEIDYRRLIAQRSIDEVRD
jgi:hypothetical protein